MRNQIFQAGRSRRSASAAFHILVGFRSARFFSTTPNITTSPDLLVRHGNVSLAVRQNAYRRSTLSRNSGSRSAECRHHRPPCPTSTAVVRFRRDRRLRPTAQMRHVTLPGIAPTIIISVHPRIAQCISWGGVDPLLTTRSPTRSRTTSLVLCLRRLRHRRAGRLLVQYGVDLFNAIII
jgi:hypothetical protein